MKVLCIITNSAQLRTPARLQILCQQRFKGQDFGRICAFCIACMATLRHWIISSCLRMCCIDGSSVCRSMIREQSDGRRISQNWPTLDTQVNGGDLPYPEQLVLRLGEQLPCGQWPQGCCPADCHQLEWQGWPTAAYASHSALAAQPAHHKVTSELEPHCMLC